MGCTHVPGLEAAWAEVGVADHLLRDARRQDPVVSGEQRDRRDRLHELRVPWRPTETGEGSEGR